MRDASRIRERPENSSSRGPIVWSALGAVMVLVLTFSLGMIVGKRTAASATPNPDGITLADIEEAKDLREDLKRILGITRDRCDLVPEYRGDIERDRVVIEKWIWTSEPGSRVPCVLYRPTDPVDRMPAVVLTCGHGGSKS